MFISWIIGLRIIILSCMAELKNVPKPEVLQRNESKTMSRSCETQRDLNKNKLDFLISNKGL